jgi:Uncharacterized protein conserved in bacteria
MNEAEILALIGKVDKDTQREVYLTAAKLITKADHYYKPLKGLIVPRFEYDLKGTTAGQAYAKYKAQDFWIRLNNEALRNPEYKDYMFDQMIPHEVAHSVVQQLWPQHGAHGWKWQEVMYLFGVPPLRTHDMPLRKARKTRRFVHKCLGCANECNIGLNAHRKLVADPHYYRCVYCNSYLNQNGSEVK